MKLRFTQHENNGIFNVIKISDYGKRIRIGICGTCKDVRKVVDIGTPGVHVDDWVFICTQDNALLREITSGSFKGLVDAITMWYPE